MATHIDAVASLYYLFNTFIQELKSDSSLPDFDFTSTTSLEATAALLDTETDKIVVMQKSKTEKNKFNTIVYNLVPSFATTKDLNAMLTLKVFSAFEVLYKKYSAIPIYEAAGLEATTTVLNPTGTKLVIQDLEQETLGAGQLQSNFNSLKITFIGHLC